MPVTTLTDATFAADVLAHSGLVVVDIWAEWCTPCRALVPIFDALSAQYGERVRVMKLDADANVEVVARFEIRALPTVMIFSGGVLVDRISGAQSITRYTAAIDAQLDRIKAGGAPEATTAPQAAAPAAVPRDAEAQARELLNSPDAMVVFKHSSSCPVSFMAKRQVDGFVAENPHVPTRTVVVQLERDLSNALETVSRIRHESPQVFIVQNGRVLWDASHGSITQRRLTSALASLAPQS